MIDLTGIATACIAGVFSVLAIVLPLVINNRMKDKQAALVLGNALTNALGSMQAAASGVITNLHPVVTLPSSVPPTVAVGVNYVLAHAGDEIARLGITPLMVADKIVARLGVVSIESNLAAAASPGPTPRPLDPILPPHTV